MKKVAHLLLSRDRDEDVDPGLTAVRGRSTP